MLLLPPFLGVHCFPELWEQGTDTALVSDYAPQLVTAKMPLKIQLFSVLGRGRSHILPILIRQTNTLRFSPLCSVTLSLASNDSSTKPSFTLDLQADDFPSGGYPAQQFSKRNPPSSLRDYMQMSADAGPSSFRGWLNQFHLVCFVAKVPEAFWLLLETPY